MVEDPRGRGRTSVSQPIRPDGPARRPRTFRRQLGSLVILVAILLPPRANGSGEPPDRDHDHDHEGAMALELFERMVEYNLDNPAVLPSAAIDAFMAGIADRPLGERIGAWARFWLTQGDIAYVYGRAPGGYVTQGRLAQDFATDCVLFMYRTTELARSGTATEAAQFAFGTRFYGAITEQVVRPDGRVTYDDPSHLEYAEDMAKSGIWGADVTDDCGESVADAVGSSRTPPDTLRYVPRDKIDYSALREGDLVWFVGDETRPGAIEQRMQGTLLHHLGILVRDGEEVSLIHPAAVPLSGVYDRTGVVRVPLRTYLQRVDRFKGIVVTRLVDF